MNIRLPGNKTYQISEKNMFDLSHIDLKKEMEDMAFLGGLERGADIKFLRHYARIKAGNSGIRAIEGELAQAGVGLPDFAKLKDLEWISAKLPTIYMLAMAKVFGWSEKEVYEMGHEALTIHVALKFLLKYFSSPSATFSRAARRWQKSYSFGKMEIVDFDGTGRKVVVRLLDFKKHPITCVYLRGIFVKIVEIATGSERASIEETKCVFRGDPYHEYLITWV
jgi:hypothetical protein